MIELLFGIYPELDLKLAALFYDPATESFPLKLDAYAELARNVAMWLSWALAVPSIAALVIKLIWPERRLMMSGRASVPVGDAVALGRHADQFQLQELLGPPASGGGDAIQRRQGNSWRGGIRAAPARKIARSSPARAPPRSGPIAPAALTPPAWRPLAYAAATLFGIATSVLRMAFGGHFFTDVATAGLVTFLVIWLTYGYIYRWPRPG